MVEIIPADRRILLAAGHTVERSGGVSLRLSGLADRFAGIDGAAFRQGEIAGGE
jgi:hypothetical protein